MPYARIAKALSRKPGVELSTMMKSPCLRYQGDFVAMMFEKEDCLIVKLSAARVDALIDAGIGLEFNFTKKTFREWVLIPRRFEDEFEAYVLEALDHAKSRKGEVGMPKSGRAASERRPPK